MPLVAQPGGAGTPGARTQVPGETRPKPLQAKKGEKAGLARSVNWPDSSPGDLPVSPLDLEPHEGRVPTRP